MTTTIIQADIDKAEEAYASHRDLCLSCVIFQAAKRAGFELESVGWGSCVFNGKYIKLNGYAHELSTTRNPDEWQASLGKLIEIPFHMRNWYAEEVSDFGKIREIPNCGTAACIAGWAHALTAKQNPNEAAMDVFERLWASTREKPLV